MPYGLTVNSSAGVISIDGLRAPRIYGKVTLTIPAGAAAPYTQTASYPASWPSKTQNPAGSIVFLSNEHVFNNGAVWSYDEYGDGTLFLITTFDDAARTFTSSLSSSLPATYGFIRRVYFMSYGETS